VAFASPDLNQSVFDLAVNHCGILRDRSKQNQR
jgi:hypothetical protein